MFGEASFLNTGFSNYYHQIIDRVYHTGKFDVAEFGSYASTNDLRVSKLPHKFYGNMPDIVGVNNGEVLLNPDQVQVYEADYKLNQFGKWRFHQVICDWKPDIIFAIRDHWMDEWMLKSPYRQFFKFVWMPTIDGTPQHKKWIQDYAKADAVFSYSKWGKEVIEEESFGKVKVLGVPSPGVDTEVFKPLDKLESRKYCGFDKDNAVIVGTVMRNQQRKLFCELILSYKKLVEKVGKLIPKSREQVKIPYLLLHTSTSDVGWNIPLEIERSGLKDFILITYMCPSCRSIKISPYSGERIPCSCGKSMQTSNTNIGMNRKELSVIYNCMDLYVQLSVCEGWGLPIYEAKSCGVPVIGVDCTAMSEQLKDEGCWAVKSKTEFTDSGTMQRRTFPDLDDLTSKMYNFFYLYTDRSKEEWGKKLRQSVIGTWDKSAQILIDYFDKCETEKRVLTWDKPIDIVDVDYPIDLNQPYEAVCCNLYTKLLKIPPSMEAISKFKKDNIPINEIVKTFRKRAEAKNKLERLRVWGSDKQDHVLDKLDPMDKFRILYVMPETAGDVLMSTAVVEGIKNKWPDATIYFATKDKYKSVLDGFPLIKKVLPYHEDLLNYRNTEGCGPDKGEFDIVFAPYIVSQKISHIWHNGHGKHMIDTYADVCGVKAGDVFIDRKPFKINYSPRGYITIHTGSSLDIKNYDYFQSLVEYSNFPVVHVGGPNDPKLKNVLDLRGKTSPQELADVLANSLCHIGVDSFPGHVASAMGTRVVTLFGATFPSGCAPKQNKEEFVGVN